jgi:tRNA U55 pseudouridine synthase TruB
LNSKECPKNLQIALFRAKTTKGIYVRSLIQDIAQKAGTLGFSSQIIRLTNGKYGQKDCYLLRDLFNKKELSGEYFYSKFKSNLH